MIWHLCSTARSAACLEYARRCDNMTRQRQDAHVFPIKHKSADPLGVSEGILSSKFKSNLHIRSVNNDMRGDATYYEKVICHNSQPDTENVTQQGIV